MLPYHRDISIQGDCTRKALMFKPRESYSLCTFSRMELHISGVAERKGWINNSPVPRNFPRADRESPKYKDFSQPWGNQGSQTHKLQESLHRLHITRFSLQIKLSPRRQQCRTRLFFNNPKWPGLNQWKVSMSTHYKLCFAGTMETPCRDRTKQGFKSGFK